MAIRCPFTFTEHHMGAPNSCRSIKMSNFRLTLKNVAVAAALTTSALLSACNGGDGLPSSVSELTFKTLDGQSLGLTDLDGPILVSFWATDCGICIKEMPEMAELYETYESKGFELVAVAMPYDPPNRVLEMAEREQWPFPVALDIKGEALAAFANVKGTPTSYLLDKEGQLVKRYVGAIAMDKMEKQLLALLDSSTS